jgi:hypothetical protein
MEASKPTDPKDGSKRTSINIQSHRASNKEMDSSKIVLILSLKY